MVRDAVTGRERTYLKGRTDNVTHAVFSPDGKTLAGASRDGTVKLWDAVTGQERATLRGHTAGVWSVRFSPDGQTLASASADRTINLWDATPYHRWWSP
jgi:WD40 repeat protein